MTKESIVKSPSGRTKRASLVAKGPLAVRGLDTDGWHYRWVNDTDDRVAALAEAGYEVVSDKDVTAADKRVDSASSVGSGKVISAGGGIKAVLMRQRLDWYEEDQIEKEKEIKALENATRKEALDGTYGKLETKYS